MLTIRRTRGFDRWIDELKDRSGRARILLRLERLATGNPGQVAPIGEGLSELKINTGPGYRVYYLQQDEELILLLCGGDKSSQRRDIAAAKRLAAQWREDRQGGSQE